MPPLPEVIFSNRRGSSAYDLYNKLKAQGGDADTLARYRERLLHQLLTTQPLRMLSDFAVPTNKEPALSVVAGRTETDYLGRTNLNRTMSPCPLGPGTSKDRYRLLEQ